MSQIKVCQKCQKEFDTVQVIGDKRRTFYNRKYCFECSPFGSHNTCDLKEKETRYQEINGQKLKKCTCCGGLKSIEDFYSKSEWGRRFSVCAECSRKNSKQRRIEFKKWCVEYKGGKCICCGYNKCILSLDFHHRDPSEKDFIISRAWKKDKEIVKKELDKCDLVCSNCHGEIHERIGFF